MTAWNGKIRARNVLVGGGGIELASAEFLVGLMVPNVCQSNPNPDYALLSLVLSSLLDG